MINYLAIFIGGGIGSLARYSIARAVAGIGYDFPFGTLVANLLSCFVLGYIIGLVEEKNLLIDPAIRLFFVIGFCGGFSTFSTFTFETFELYRNGQYYFFIANVLGNMALCIGSLLGGMVMSRL